MPEDAPVIKTTLSDQNDNGFESRRDEMFIAHAPTTQNNSEESYEQSGLSRDSAPNGAKRVSTRSGSDGIIRSTCISDPVATAPGTDTLVRIILAGSPEQSRALLPSLFE